MRSLACYYSHVFGLEGTFTVDVGKDYIYRNDPPNDKDANTVTTPSFDDAWSTSWNQLSNKHVKTPLTYIKSSILGIFK